MIDKATILKIAKLSRLAVSDNQTDVYSKQLSIAMKHFEEISKVDTAGIEPLITPIEIEPWTRQDVVGDRYEAEDLLSNAPDRVGNLFKVPPVV